MSLKKTIFIWTFFIGFLLGFWAFILGGVISSSGINWDFLFGGVVVMVSSSVGFVIMIGREVFPHQKKT
jgi:hypothetical protein